MATYKSIHTGAQVDTAVTNVLNDDCKVKYGNFIGNLEDQQDLVQALNEAGPQDGDSSVVEDKHVNVRTDVLGYMTGAPSQDAKLIETIRSQAHSTFDSSKFTLFGNAYVDEADYHGFPEQGRIGGFDSESYAAIKLNIGGNSIKLELSTLVWSISSLEDLVNSDYVKLQITENSEVMLSVTDGSSTYVCKTDSIDIPYKKYISAYYNGGTGVCIIDVYDDNRELVTSVTDTEATKMIFPSEMVELKIGGPTNPFEGEISAKGFCVEVDDIPVFMSDKTNVNWFYGPSYNLYTHLYAYVSGESIIYADSATVPTQLFDNYGRAYTGTDWEIVNGEVVVTADQSVATYDDTQDITYIQEAILPVASGPIINEAGVARGFDTGKYIESRGYYEGGSVELFFSFRLDAVSVPQDILNSERYSIRVENAHLVITTRDTSNNEATLTSNIEFSPGVIYDLHYDYEASDTSMRLNLFDVATGEQLDRVELSDTGVGSYDDQQVCLIGGPNHPLKGWINLNNFYMGNNAVEFWRTLPYAETAAGFNLVYPFSADMVDKYAEYNQGDALYCSIRKDGSVTLPHGNLYGYITKAAQGQSYIDDLYSRTDNLQMSVEDLYGQIGNISAALSEIIGENNEE